MRGFTLIELLLVIAIIVILAGLTIPFAQSTQVSNDLSSYTIEVLTTLRQAQNQAVFGQNASGWGVYFDNSNKNFIFFKGDLYPNRDPDFDQIFLIPESFNINNDFGDEISFSIFSGQPTASGTVELTSVNNQTKSILINSYGKIELGN